MVREARDAGQTVFLSSHVLSEIEHVADRVTVLREGRVVLTSTVAALRARLGLNCAIQLARPVPVAEFVRLPGVRRVEASPQDPAHLRFLLEGSPDALIKALSRHTVLDLTAEHPDLEAIVMGLYRADADPDGGGRAGGTPDGATDAAAPSGVPNDPPVAAATTRAEGALR